VPGNHDWYDGLTAFLRIFAQRRPIGAWRTAQTRSYFAAELPHGWWLVGLDTQLGTYIDEPQIRYFKEHLSQQVRPGDAVIVCAPTPSWVHTGQGEPDAFNSLHFFEREVVQQCEGPDGVPRPTGARVLVWISGDQHHYARYSEEVTETSTVQTSTAQTSAAQTSAAQAAAESAARQLFTCGLGGAYLLGTTELPDRLELPPTGSRMSGRSPSAWFRRQASWPSALQSRRMESGVFSLGSGGIFGRNPGLWLLIGLVHAFFLPVLAFVLGLEQGRWPGAVLLDGSPRDVLGLAEQLGAWLGAATALACLVPVLHLRRPRRPAAWVGALALQLVVALGTLAAAVALPWPRWQAWQVLGAAGLGAFVVAGFAGCYALAGFLALTRNHDVLFSAQAIEDGKGFLRMHLDAAGKLTVYPVLVERVCHDWELEQVDPVPPATVGRVRPVPATGSPSRRPVTRLIEEPVVVPGASAASQLTRGERSHP
jgi:hypothetical protein